MPGVKQSPEKTVTGDLRLNGGYESYSDDTETGSRKSVVSRMMIKVFGGRVRNQIERIRAEDSHLGEDIGECLIARVCGAINYNGVDDHVVSFSRPVSPLSGSSRGCR